MSPLADYENQPEKADLLDRKADPEPPTGAAFCTSRGARAAEHQRFYGSCGHPL